MFQDHLSMLANWLASWHACYHANTIHHLCYIMCLSSVTIVAHSVFGLFGCTNSTLHFCHFCHFCLFVHVRTQNLKFFLQKYVVWDTPRKQPKGLKMAVAQPRLPSECCRRVWPQFKFVQNLSWKKKEILAYAKEIDSVLQHFPHVSTH